LSTTNATRPTNILNFQHTITLMQMAVTTNVLYNRIH